MATPAWYNDNSFRDYPFITRRVPLSVNEDIGSSSSSETLSDLPHSAIVDFGAIMEIDANYDEAAGHSVYLHRITRAGDTFYFYFRTTAQAAANSQIIFTRQLTDAEFLITWDDAINIEAEPVEQLDCQSLSKWSGFLVTGDLTQLADIVDDGDTVIYIPELWQIEPARIQSLRDTYLRAINLANNPRSVVTPIDQCVSSDSSSSSSDDTAGDAIIQALCVAGNIKWKPGYNCTIRQDILENAIVIGAGVGNGEGEPCEEIPLDDTETPPIDSNYLSGGPDCADLIRAINGVQGPNVTILGGPGFTVQQSTDDDNTLIVDMPLHDFAICDITTETSSLSA